MSRKFKWVYYAPGGAHVLNCSMCMLKMKQKELHAPFCCQAGYRPDVDVEYLESADEHDVNKSIGTSCESVLDQSVCHFIWI